MSAHVLFSLLNKFRKSDKMLGLHFIAFLNSLNKFNNTKAQTLHYIYHLA